eukprot:12228662-Alexandrium_andersonii.AAC.1
MRPIFAPRFMLRLMWTWMPSPISTQRRSCLRKGPSSTLTQALRWMRTATGMAVLPVTMSAAPCLRG